MRNPSLKGRRGLMLAGFFGLLIASWSLSAQAQTCTIDNWSAPHTGLTNDDVGTQGANNRRYGGPCGLRVPLDGTVRFLTDESPSDEPRYIARVYAFFSEVTEQTIFFEADDGADSRIGLWYNVPTANDITLNVVNAGGDNFVTIADVGTGWKSIEFVWEASAETDNIVLAVGDRNGVREEIASIDTTGFVIRNAHIGNMDGVTGGTIDFDDFDSRRVIRPGRLLVGDANNDSNVDGDDVLAVVTEFLGGPSASAAGQPDCNEDGAVDGDDVACIVGIFLGG